MHCAFCGIDIEFYRQRSTLLDSSRVCVGCWLDYNGVSWDHPNRPTVEAMCVDFETITRKAS